MTGVCMTGGVMTKGVHDRGVQYRGCHDRGGHDRGVYDRGVMFGCGHAYIFRWLVLRTRSCHVSGPFHHSDRPIGRW